MQKRFTFTETAYNLNAANEVLPYLIRIFRPRSILDIGCGLGTWLKVAKELGINDVFGVDNVKDKALKVNPKDFRLIDLRNQFTLHRTFDLVLCLEVAEHLPESSAELLVESISMHGDTVLFSAAIPFQGGQDHINEQWPQYWLDLFRKHDFNCYDNIRHQYWLNSNVDFWYRQNMLIFSKSDLSVLTWKPITTCNSYVHPELLRDKLTEIENLKWQLEAEKKTGIKKSLKKCGQAIKERVFRKKHPNTI